MIAWLPELAAAAIAVLLCLLFRQGWHHAQVSNRPLPAHAGWRALLFLGGLLLFMTAFAFPAHTVLPEMVEQVLLAFAVPPLLLLGVPRPVLLPLFERRTPRRLLQALTRPARAAAIFLIVLFLWYLPGPFDETLAHSGLRLVAGLSILAAALLFWWPIIEPFPSWERELADLGKLLYLFIGSTALKLPGFILAIMPRPIYRLPPGISLPSGLSALTDQQYAGWLMVAMGTFVLLAAATVVCANLLYEPEEAADGSPRSRSRGEIGRWGDGGIG